MNDELTFVAEVRAKVETKMQDGVQYILHVGITLNAEDASDDAAQAGWKVGKAVWDRYKVGDVLHFGIGKVVPLS